MKKGCGAAIVLGGLLITLAGCATTRRMEMGPLDGVGPLVTLVVTEDRAVVQRECDGIITPGRIMGCRVIRRVKVDEDVTVQAMKIVRYTDSLPSPLAFEIDAHELCHAIASLQAIDDPCHVDNYGFVQASFGSPGLLSSSFRAR